MADGTGIEWADATWGPLVGCTKVSPGCDNCYAEKVVNRWNAAGNPAFPESFDTVHVRSDRLHLYEAPLRWERPRRIFVNSLSDLFHKDVPDEVIADIFAIMACATQHSFQLLTKRHGRMRSLLSSYGFEQAVLAAIAARRGSTAAFVWPLPHLWLGVSVENQEWADIRIPALIDTPAAVRWISAEPLLGPVDISDVLARGKFQGSGFDHRSSLDWVVAGGESGPDARPMHPAWGRQLRDQCAVVGVPFLWKQWGSWAPVEPGDRVRQRTDSLVQFDGTVQHSWDALPGPTDQWMRRMSKHAAGRLLDGRLHDGYPA